MQHYGLIGYPLEHSLSMPLHLAAFRAIGIEADYSLFTVPPFPQGELSLTDLLACLRRGELHGLNVTIPHKQNVIPFLDELTPTAQAIGAVNTIFLREGRICGENTDAPGFWLDLCAQFPELIRPSGAPKQALLLGAGGAARAVLYALAKEGWQVWLAARRLEQAQGLLASIHLRELSEDAPNQIDCRTLSNQALQPLLSGLDLIINATPVGMLPKTGASPYPSGLDFPSQAVVYDLVYNPPITLLVQQARQAGLPAASGLGMLVEQAALADEHWIGKSPLRAPMFAVVPPHLRGT